MKLTDTPASNRTAPLSSDFHVGARARFHFTKKKMENPAGLVHPSPFTEAKTRAERGELAQRRRARRRQRPRAKGLYELDFQRHVVSARVLMLCAETLSPSPAPLSESEGV